MSIELSYRPEFIPINDQDIRSSVEKVLRDKELQDAMGDDKRDIITQVKLRVNDDIRKINKGINSLILNSKKLKEDIYIDSVNQIYAFLKQTDDELVKNAFESYFEPVSAFAYKYVESDNVEEMISKGWVKCGTASEYRQTDPDEMKALLLGNFDSPDIFEKVFSRVTNQILEEKGISIDDVISNIDRIFSSLFFICCVTDQKDSKYMWHEYGGGKNEKGGACMKIRICPYPFHYVTYSDAPVESKYVLEKWNTFCQSISNDLSDNTYNNYLKFSNHMLSIELLNLFRKNVHDKDGKMTSFPLEHEIRYLVDKKSLESKNIGKHGKKFYFFKTDVVAVISDLPDTIDEKIRILCEDKGIEYSRRIR